MFGKSNDSEACRLKYFNNKRITDETEKKARKEYTRDAVRRAEEDTWSYRRIDLD